MVHRFNLNWARSPLGAEYIWVCVTDPSHVIEVAEGKPAAS